MRNASARARRDRRAFSIVDLGCTLVAVVLLLAVVLPALGRTAKSSMLATSFGNLMDLGAAHALYAAEWNDRQLTFVVDDISAYGNSPGSAFGQYRLEFFPAGHPPVGLGWGTVAPGGELVYFAYRVNGGNTANMGLLVPIRFDGSGRYFGSFRLPNAEPFHHYVGGRFYDPTFYAPADRPVWETVVANGCIDSPEQYPDCIEPVPNAGDLPAWSSYCLSPAAMFHPDVMRSELDGGWQDPWDLDHGFASPAVSQARYPSLKTRMLEHNWVQNAPKDVCNPSWEFSVYGNCEPYWFNQAIDSAPATLFYDLSVRLLPNTEANAADQQVQKQTGAGLWHRGTPFGAFGYLGQFDFDDSQISHHILTTDGILGRDTVAGAGR